MLVAALEFFGRPVKSYTAVFQEQHTVHVRYPLEMMGDKDHRFALKHFEHGVQHLVFGAGIEANCWFVEDDDRRILQKDACQGDTMTLAARKAQSRFIK